MAQSAVSPKQFIRDLKDRDTVQSVFLATDKAVLTDRNGKSYMSFNLADSSGSINARIWDRIENWIGAFEPGDFVRIKGFVQTYQNRRQIIVHEVQRTPATDVQIQDFVARAVADPKQMLERLREIANTIKGDHLRQLVVAVLNDPTVEPLLLKAPAAKTIHHAYMGGLLEHILSILSIMEFLAAHYPRLDRDLLLFGAIFHDIGKIWELSFEDGIKYTDRGRLVGHMAIACELIDEHARNIAGFPAELRDILKHIVLSHHGKLEHGSPKEPAIPEAVVVAMIDDLDSKLNTILGFMDQELATGDRWTRLNTQFERYFFLEVLRRKAGEPAP